MYHQVHTIIGGYISKFNYVFPVCLVISAADVDVLTSDPVLKRTVIPVRVSSQHYPPTASNLTQLSVSQRLIEGNVRRWFQHRGM